MRQFLDPSLRSALAAATGLAALAAAAPAGAAGAADASAWVKGAQSEARLVSGGALPGSASGPTSGSALLAGVEIRLQPHFITYWRDPGDAGVPPTFAFAGSTNLKSATVRYPAPSRLDEAGAAAFGYAGGVVFPVVVEPEDPSKPVAIALTLDYAACHDICLPAHADLHLALDARPTPEAARLQDALAAVPRTATVGSAGPAPAVLAVSTPDAAGGFTVRAALPEGGSADAGAALFVEAPEGWAYTAGPAAPDGPGRASFPVKQLDAPKGQPHPSGPLLLTLTTGAGAVEVPVEVPEKVPAALDAAGTKP